MNPWIYLFLIVGGDILAFIFAIFAMDRATQEIAPAVPIPILIAAIANLVMLAKMWRALPYGVGRTTAGKAVGLMFVPFVNIYWVFNVFGGFATDFNQHVLSSGLSVPKISKGAAIGYALLSVLFIPVVSWIVKGWAIVHICSRVRALKRATADTEARSGYPDARQQNPGSALGY